MFDNILCINYAVNIPLILTTFFSVNMEILSNHDFHILYLYEFESGNNGTEAAKNINFSSEDNNVNGLIERFWL